MLSNVCVGNDASVCRVGWLWTGYLC